MIKPNYLPVKCLFGVLFAFLGCCLMSCGDEKDDDTNNGAYDPTKPIEITGFIPKSGGVGQKLIVYGNNFGNDPSIVKVNIGGKPSTLINVNNEGLYCFVPQGAYSGKIKVTVGDENRKTQEAEASEAFNYERKMVVGHLLGYRNKDDDQGWHDGSFSTCTGFRQVGLFKWDPLDHDLLYVVFDHDNPGIQCIDFKTKTLKTVIPRSKFNNNRLRDIDFTLDGKYMLVSVDENYGTRSNSVYIVERDAEGNFSKNCYVQVLAAYKQCNGAAIHPVNGEMYFNSFEQGQVFRLDLKDYFDTLAKGETWDPYVEDNKDFKMLFTIQDREWEFKIVMHPTGKYAYIVVHNRNYILRMDYDESRKQFAPPYVVAGGIGAAGYNDAVGTDARFNCPYQGIFVKNEEYEKEGRSDIYDFYIVDLANHCVRKVTPEGIVSTFAGRGSRTSAADNNVWGTDNGDLREVARFRDPSGLAYDERTKTFYILDTTNRSVRTISMETDDSDNSDDSEDSAKTENEKGTEEQTNN